MKKFLPVILIAIGFLLPVLSSAQVVECPAERNDCSTAQLMCSPIEQFNNPTPVGSPAPFPGCPSNVIDNQFWYRFVPITPNITMNITSANCQNSSGIQAGIYTDCSNLNAPLVNPQCGCTTGPITFAFAVTPGEEYYVMVDGCAGDICDVTIEVVDGQIDTDGGGGGGPGSTPPAPYGDPLIVCNGTTGIYNFAPIGPGTYIWLLDGGTISTGTTVNASCTPTANGTEGLIEILWENFSGMPSTDCFNLTYEYIPAGTCGQGTAVESDPLEICFEDEIVEEQGFFCLREEPDGYFYPGDNNTYFDGVYNTVLPGGASSGCDLYVELEVTSFFAIDSILFFAVCPGDSVEVEGEFYQAPQNGTDIVIEDFYDNDPNGEKFCDKYIQLTMVELDPDVQIGAPNGTEISCVDTEVTLFADADPTDVDYVWTTPDGSIVPVTDDTIRATSAGTYIVTVELESFGTSCFKSDTIVVTENIDNPSVSATKTDIVCGGETNGTASASGSGGIPPYTFAWSNGGNTASISNLPAGTYTVTITGANGCTNEASATIDEPDPLTLSTSVTDADCNGASDGEASASPMGGTGAYTYAWSTSPVQTTQTATGLTAGTYTVTVTDENGCSNTETAVIGEPTAVTSTISSIAAGCAGGDDGSATVTANGGTGAYTYSWSTTPAQTTATATGLSTGTYTVTITDANGCTNTNSVDVGEAPAIVLTPSGTDALCFGGSDGEATVSATGGTGAYTYAWSTAPVQTTATATGLTTGTYTVVVTDANGCSTTDQVTIDEPDELIISVSGVDPRCSSSADGSVSVTASGGTGAYTYAWSTTPPQNTQTASLIPGGTYTVTVTDNNGCSVEDQITINPPNALNAALDATNDVSCNGGSDGSATVSATGGTAPYDYQWPVTAGGQTTPTATGLSQGTYVVTITDDNNCSTTVTVTIDEPTAVDVTAVVDGDVLCNGGADGSASASGSGGTGAYTYTWSSGTPNGASVTGLTVGTHTVTISDANGCTTTDEVNITEPTVLVIDASSFTDPLCNSAADGSATVSVSGGTPTYTYAWSRGSSTNATATGLTAGPITVTVTDANGCSITQDFTLTDPDPVVASIDNTTDVLCSYSSDGTATASGTGGLPPYTYTWSSGTANGNDVSDLGIGTVTVTVSDANGCTGTATASIGAPPALDLQMSQEDALCRGESNGSASVVVTGGTSPYTYNWSNGQFNSDATNIAAGPHTVTVTDANGCTAENNINVGEPAEALSMTGTSADATCGEANGVIELFPAGGTAPYTFNWPQDSDDRQVRDDLAPGTYNPIVTDANGCTFTVQVIVSTANQFQIDAIAAEDVLCNGGSDGAVNVDVSGGVPPYTYAWSSSEVTEDISGLTIGTYTITVTDNTGCTLVADALVEQPDVLATTAQVVDSDCGQSTGSVSVSPTGGVLPYTYTWNTGGSTTATLSGVPLGDYTVTITDANGCTFVETQSVGNPNSPEITSITGTDLLCFEDNSGEIEVVVTNGTPPFTYNWVQSEPIGANPSGLPAGTYTVMITDSRNCETMADVTITEPALLEIQSITAVPALCGQSNGSIQVTPIGGTAPYTYSWPGISSTSDNPTGLAPGNYVVNITDANGCTVQGAASTVAPGEVQVSAQVADALCFDGDDGGIDVTLTGGTGPFTFSWDYQSATTEDLTSLPAGDYVLTVTDGNGCTFVNQYTVDHPAELTANSVAQDATCGNADGGISLRVQGGVSPYTYIWSDGSGTTTQDVSGLLPGDYTVTITDANGCILLHSDEVELPDGPTVEFASVIDAQCFNALDGVVELNVTGGTQPYTFQWSDANSSGASSDELGAGPVSITVTDAKNCEIILDTMINHPDELLRDELTINQATCGNPNGSINLTMIGGTQPYTYNWSNQLPDSPDQTSLASGSYQVTVVDAQGCTYEESFSVSEPGELNAVEFNQTDVSCNGGSDGEVVIETTGGTAPYTYDWNVAAIGNDSIATGLSIGTVSVSVTDANGCEVVVTSLIEQPDALDIIQTGGSDATCNQDNGSIEVDASGGIAPYTYTWPNPIPQGPNPQDLAAGSYIVTVTDANGCTYEESFSVEQPGQPTYSVSTDSVNCNGEANGSVLLDISGGQAPFTYQWSDNQSSTTEDLTGVTAGSYTVTITDAIGCTYTAQASVGQPEPIIINNASALDATCNGGNSGSLAITVAGGTPPFTYNWSNGDQSDNPTSLAAGNYQVTITDKNGCSLTSDYNVAEPEALALSLSVDDADCNGAADGSIISTVSGGTGAYTYQWSNNATTAEASGLTAGPYNLVVTDANGCTIEASAIVDQPGPIDILVTDISEYGIYNVSCNDSEDGSVTVTAQGSTAPYTYLWNTGETGNSLTDILPGTYEVLVTDGNGCTKTEEVTLIAPEPLTPAILAEDPTCFGYSNGLVYLESISGGTAPFMYSIDGQPFTLRPDFRNLAAGSYEVAVQDANGCEWTDAVTLSEPTPLIVELRNALDTTGDNTITIEYGDDAIIETFYNHPVQDYQWTGTYLPSCGNLPPDSCNLPLNEITVSPEETTDYTLYFLDENNCSVTTSIRVNVDKPRRVFIPNVFSPNSENTENAVFTIFTGRGVSMINKFEIFNRWGEVIYSLPQPEQAELGANMRVAWDGRFRDEPMNPGVFVYYAEIVFADGHVEVYTGDVTLVR